MQCLVLLYNAIGNQHLPLARTLAQARSRQNSKATKLFRSRTFFKLRTDGDSNSAPSLGNVLQDACVENLYAQALLGRAMPRRGKGSVLRVLGDGCHRDTGTAEWCNALALFINVGGKRFNNEFFNEGREVTWFASRRQCMEGLLSRVIAQALSSDKDSSGAFFLEQQLRRGDASDDDDGTSSSSSSSSSSPSSSLFFEGGKVDSGAADTQQQSAATQMPVASSSLDIPEGEGSDRSVLLFCRTQDQPYIFLGKLELIRVHLEAAPVKLVWKLAEYEDLRNSLYFQQILYVSSNPSLS